MKWFASTISLRQRPRDRKRWHDSRSKRRIAAGSRSRSSSHDMTDTELIEVVRRLAITFERRKISHALIGGLAVGLRSRPRTTKDADFIVNIPALAFPDLLEELVGDGYQIDG